MFCSGDSRGCVAIDAATVAGYYGSDSAGTFLTAVGVLAGAQIAYAAYMPVMLAVMEIPGCLVALYLIAKMRQSGMDPLGNMPGETHYSLVLHRSNVSRTTHRKAAEAESLETATVLIEEEEFVGAGVGARRRGSSSHTVRSGSHTIGMRTMSLGQGEAFPPAPGEGHRQRLSKAEQQEADLALEHVEEEGELVAPRKRSKSIFSREMLHEVFFNPGIYLLFAGIAIGFVSRLQGTSVTNADDQLFVNLFQGMLCLFLLEMGMTASAKLKDLKAGGWQFVVFGLAAPNLFAALGMVLAHGYSLLLGEPFEIGTYVLFAVLCGAASYIALPAV